MIVRTMSGHHLVTAQPEHARQSAVLAAHLGAIFLGDHGDRRTLLVAAHHHDDGWREWEQSPRITPDGLPVDFLAMEREEHFAIWERAIFGTLQRHGPGPASLIARHAMGLFTSHDHAADAYFDELIRTLESRAWPGMAPEEARLRAERGFAALYLCDLLSLIAVSGRFGRSSATLLRPDGSSLAIEAWLEGDWTVRVDPWPFCLDRLTAIHVDGCMIPFGQESHALDLLRHPRELARRVAIDYIPL